MSTAEELRMAIVIPPTETTPLNSTEPWEVFSWFGKHVATSENSASGKLLVFELF